MVAAPVAVGAEESVKRRYSHCSARPASGLYFMTLIQSPVRGLASRGYSPLSKRSNWASACGNADAGGQAGHRGPAGHLYVVYVTAGCPACSLPGVSGPEACNDGQSDGASFGGEIL